MIAITGSTGQLGRLVIAELLARKVDPKSIVALARDPAKAKDLGVAVRAADYTKPETLERALQGVDKLLLISSSEVGQRAAQHGNVIAAAKKTGVKLIAYTSVLRAPSSPLGLAKEHAETEKMLAASGVPHVLLRNGWYTENYAMGIPAALEHGVVMGAAKQGRISAAARADYAAAAAAVLLSTGDEAGKTYELAGDTSFTMAEFAATLAKLSGKPVAYKDMPEADYEAALKSFGLPAPIANLLAGSDTGISKGGLEDNGKVLSKLIGRPTATLEQVLKAAIK